MRKHSKDMLHGPLLSGIIAYTIPVILTGFLQLLFNAADMIVVGQFRGSIALAAVGATGAITNLIINMFMGLSVGAGVAVAHGMGGHEDTEVSRMVHTALPTALVSGGILTVVGVAFSRTFLQWMGTDPDVIDLSTRYMQIYFCGITFTMVYNFCASILLAAGDTKSPLIFLTAAGVINVLLNLVFVIALGMSVEGVALATVISQAISAVLVVLVLMSRQDACRLQLWKIRFYKPQLIKMLRIGVPAGVQGSLFSISNVTIQSAINSFGDVVMSGNAAAGNIEGFIYVSTNAFHQTAVNFIGQNMGARQYKRVSQTFWACLGCVAVVGISMSILANTFGQQLLGIYITDSPEAIQVGLTRFMFVCLPYFLFGLMDVTTGGLRGMGISTIPMITSVLGICVFRVVWVMTIFQIPQLHTLECLYSSYGVSWILTFAVQFVFFVKYFKRLLKPEMLPTKE